MNPPRRNWPYRVLLNGREIDKVFRGQRDSVDTVRDGLVNHDGYDPRIIVLKDWRD